MQLAQAVGQVQLWISEANLGIQFCLDRFALYCLSSFIEDRTEVENHHIQDIDERLETSFKKIILINNQLTHIWKSYPVHESPVQLKNMVDSEHLYNNLKKEYKEFLIQYREVMGEPYKEKLDKLSFGKPKIPVFKF